MTTAQRDQICHSLWCGLSRLSFGAGPECRHLERIEYLNTLSTQPLLYRSEPQSIFQRVHEAVDHRARITGVGVKVIQPRVVASIFRCATKVTVVLHCDKRLVELCIQHLI